MRHLRFQINIVLMSFLALSGISLAFPLFRALGSNSACSGHYKTHLSRAECLKFPSARGWKPEIRPRFKFSSTCQNRPTLDKYPKQVKGICYQRSDRCHGEILEPPPLYKGWPPELCYHSNGSFQTHDDRSTCVSHDSLKILVHRPNEIVIYNVKAVQWGVCYYVPEQQGLTTPDPPPMPPNMHDNDLASVHHDLDGPPGRARPYHPAGPSLPYHPAGPRPPPPYHPGPPPPDYQE